MKKLASLMLAVLMIAALCVTASAADFKAASGTPVIDGAFDDAYKAAPMIKVANAVDPATADGKTFGEAYVLWDAKNIYVYFDVTDPIISAKPSSKYVADEGTYMYEADSVEVFLNLSGETTGKTAELADQYTAAAPGLGISIWSGLGAHWAENKKVSTYATVKTDKGYAVEMQIAWCGGFVPSENAKIGICFHVNSDENAEEGRDAEYFAGVAADQSQSWSVIDAFDTITLTADTYVAPADDEPAADNTADAGIVAAAVVMACAAAVVLSKKNK